MFGFVARLIGGAVSPLIDQITAFSASFLRKLALFLVAAICMVVVVIALTFAFDLWITTLAGPIVGALAVAGLYLLIAMSAVVLALRGGTKPTAASVKMEADDTARNDSARAKDEKVDQFTAPILSMLASLGLRREQIAVLAGASLAKRLGPVPLVGIAIVAGFLVGRLWQGWEAMLSSELIESLLGKLSPGRGATEQEAGDPTA